MDEIARLAGVSKTTVHRAFSGRGRISDDTRQRILGLAEEAGYRPNRLAQGLRAARTGLIGVVVPGIQGTFYARILEGLERALQDVDHRVLLAVSRGTPEGEREHVESLLATRVDGLLIASEMTSPEYYRSVQERGVPIVFIDREVPGLSADLVATDHFEGGRLLAEHLRSLGRTRPAFLSVTDSAQRVGSIEDRWCGFRSVYRNAALLQFPFVPSLRRYQAAHPDEEEPESFSAVCRQAVLAAMDPLGDFPYDCLFGQYDHFALAAMDALRRAGRRVPEDVAVVGFDDQDFTEYSSPPLTTIRQPLARVGARAAGRLLERLALPSLPPEAFRLAPELITRRSCGAPLAESQP